MERKRWLLEDRQKKRERQKRWYNRHRDARLADARQRHHSKISPADYTALHAKQEGLCAVCQQPETSRYRGRLKNLATDHDHETGLTRGLLCWRHNRGCGYSIDELLTMAKYLQEWVKIHEEMLRRR